MIKSMMIIVHTHIRHNINTYIFICTVHGNFTRPEFYILYSDLSPSAFNPIMSPMLIIFIHLVINRVAPDQDLAGYPANFFAGYPVSGKKYPAKKTLKKNFYLHFELLNLSWKVNIEF